ncbi:unnamed protein product [Polarella glacialis]|uniref:Uncharacterized protein n=1 Tax=Polarella glacialis TaxID=89957 RepID=A0A813E2K5_POLGL|nr:unnamed protein product [Polarella glacialis]
MAVMQVLGAEALRKVSSFNVQSTSNLAWSCAKLQHKCDQLLGAAASAATAAVANSDAQALSNALWSLAALEVWHQPLQASISAKSTEMSNESTTQEVSNLCWASAKLWSHDGPALAALWGQAIARATELNKQEPSVMAWSLATLNLRSQPLLRAASAQAVLRMADFGMLETSNMSWSFARLAERGERLTNATSDAALAHHARAREFNASDQSAAPFASAMDSAAVEGLGLRPELAATLAKVSMETLVEHTGTLQSACQFSFQPFDVLSWALLWGSFISNIHFDPRPPLAVGCWHVFALFDLRVSEQHALRTDATMRKHMVKSNRFMARSLVDSAHARLEMAYPQSTKHKTRKAFHQRRS